MPIARESRGPGAAMRALATQVHPIFMLPALAASAFGAVLARAFSPLVGTLHLAAIFCALYTAHVKDGYVDFHGRGEDDDHPLTVWGCRSALAAASAGFFLCTAALAVTVGPVAALLTLPAWLVGFFHAPQLDTHPLTVTAGYPFGVSVSLLGGYYVQAEALSARALAFAVVFVTVLSGIKIVDDAMDYDYDRSIGKRTVAVALGRRRARAVSGAVMGAGLLVVVVLAAVGVFPLGSVLAVVVFAAVAAVARRADDRLATMLLIRGSYLFLAVLVVAVWFRPLESALGAF